MALTDKIKEGFERTHGVSVEECSRNPDAMRFAAEQNQDLREQLGKYPDLRDYPPTKEGESQADYADRCNEYILDRLSKLSE